MAPFFFMKYFYKKPDICVQVFGRIIDLDHPVYKSGTLYFEKGIGLIVVQKHFNPDTRECFWGAVDVWIANDIYTWKNFPEYFFSNASKEDFPIFELRKLMWALRMKPLPKEAWESYF